MASVSLRTILDRSRGVCKRRRKAAMQHNAGLTACALIYVTADLSLYSFSHQPVITDPLFYLLAIPAVIMLGLGKGGFAGSA